MHEPFNQLKSFHDLASLAFVISLLFSFSVYKYICVTLYLCSVLYHLLLCPCNILNVSLAMPPSLSVSLCVSLTMSLPLMSLSLAPLSLFSKVSLSPYPSHFACVSPSAGPSSMSFYLLFDQSLYFISLSFFSVFLSVCSCLIPTYMSLSIFSSTSHVRFISPSHILFILALSFWVSLTATLIFDCQQYLFFS